MGGGHHDAHPKWVWTPYGELKLTIGGWNPTPKNYVRNTFVTGAIIVSLAAVAFNISAEKERRVQYPHRWIPSMLWSKEFHDPESVARWKIELKKQGREWIEPIPSWWPFK